MNPGWIAIACARAAASRDEPRGRWTARGDVQLDLLLCGLSPDALATKEAAP